MTTATLSDEAMLAILKAHPGFRDRLASIVGAIGNSEGNLKEADAAEERLVEEMRLLGREAMQDWAEKRVEATEREIRRRLGYIAKVKKTPLAYEIRRDSGLRAAIPVREEPRAPVCSRRESQSSGMFAAFTAGDRGFRGGSAFRSGPTQVARALRVRDRREHDPEDCTRPCRNIFEAGKSSLDFPEGRANTNKSLLRPMAA